MVTQTGNLFVFTVLLVTSAAAQPNGSCTSQDHPIRMMFYSTAYLASDGTTPVPSAITGDGNWYTNGTDGTAVIHICGGTRDATLSTSKVRSLSYTFSGPIPGSYVDSQIPAGTYTTSGGVWVNVRNVLCNGCTVDPHKPFTTHVVFGNANVNGKNIGLRYQPLTVDAPDADPGASISEQNTPYASSPAQVIPQPYDCNTGGLVKPAWVVRGTVTSSDPLIPAGYSLQVGTAHQTLKNGTLVRAGQYSMPFEIRIESLQCFTY
jgi:hypothetical protein